MTVREVCIRTNNAGPWTRVGFMGEDELRLGKPAGESNFPSFAVLIMSHFNTSGIFTFFFLRLSSLFLKINK